MNPNKYFQLFPPFPRENKVFVAMSFAEPFQPRWENVLAPAIRSIEVNGTILVPNRVDTRSIGDSILTEILDGIASATLFLADVTTLGRVDGRPMRNDNVTYEIGLAHAIRLPEELLLFRSDSDPLLFDVANVRVNQYDPDGDPEIAKNKVSDAILDALKEIELQRHASVKTVAQSLDFTCWSMLLRAGALNSIQHLPTRTMWEAVVNSDKNAAISRLLELGALKTEYVEVTSELIDKSEGSAAELLQYRITAFGEAILTYSSKALIGQHPEVQVLLESMMQQSVDPV